LTKLAVVGVTNRLAETVAVLEQQMGWRYTTTVTRLNESSHRPGRSELTASDHRVIAERSEVDAALYALATARLDAAVRGLPRHIRWRLRRSRSRRRGGNT
jgi:hypothetical protein